MIKDNIQNIPIQKLVQNYTQHFVKIWLASAVNMPCLGSTYSQKEKLSRENDLRQLIHILNAKCENQSPHPKKESSIENTFSTTFKTILKTLFDFENDQLDFILSKDFKKATKLFIKYARNFDPSITLEDLYQACRNVWIMIGIQKMLGLPIKLTPSIFAYSMLYPYCDNYIDDPNISSDKKNIFNTRLFKRLCGTYIVPSTPHEKIVYKLVGMIESQYNRSQFPQVFNTLLTIHHAQIKSLYLLENSSSLSDLDVLNLCIEKGGASVLADGYLVSGSLTESQARSLFGYGVYLQFLDDLQDVQQDLKNGLSTVFSRTSLYGALDACTNRTFQFGNAVMEYIKCFKGQNTDPFINMIKKSIIILLIKGVSRAVGLYSNAYIRTLETFSPFHFSFLKKHRNSFSSYRIFMLRTLNEL